MDKILPPSETKHDDLVGVVSVKLNDTQDFNSLAAELAGYNVNRYEAVAVRVFIENKPIVTVYAKDKNSLDFQANGKIHVRKFKMEMTLDDFFYKVRQINFTVTTGEFSIENMEVVYE